MREIKFRAWDLTDNKWFYSSSDPLKKLNDDNWTGHEDGELVWQQYTGLKDKNGKEIYEGDVIEFKSVDGMRTPREMIERHVIKWQEPSEYGMHVGFFIPQNRYSTLLSVDKSSVEVIGNIYENPNL